MLSKVTTTEGKDWDKLILYLLFTYHKVPQSFTGFSPFELVYGRAVHGPLDILQESWEASRRSNESVESHVLMMRERLAQMSELVQENLKRAQQKPKARYDPNAWEHEFQPSNEVLVLLPTTANKLLAQW